MDERSHPIAQDLKDIEDTRAAMADKLEQLECRVQDTVEDAKTAVFDIVDNVRDAAEELVERAEELVARTKQAFDPTYQVNRHPWIMLAGAVMVGYVLGTLDNRHTATRSAQRDLPPSDASPTSRAFSTTSNSDPRDHGGENLWGGLAGELQHEIARTKGVLAEAGKTLIQELFRQVVPVLLAPLSARRAHESRASSHVYDEKQDNGSHASRLRQ